MGSDKKWKLAMCWAESEKWVNVPMGKPGDGLRKCEG